jgi:LysR family transcriptional regulator, carnitine catabolism transcriptional activator
MRINVGFRQLACFLRVASEGSFSEAARNLAVSQPALSRTIRTIEDELGAALFDRDTRNVRLTPAGAEFRVIAQRIVHEVDGGYKEFAQYLEGSRGRVVIAALPSVAAVLLPPAIAQFQRTRPLVDFTILDRLNETVIEEVSSGRAEIGITVRPPASENLSYQPLISDEFGLVCPIDDPLAEGHPLPWSIFADRPFVAMVPESSVRLMTDAAFLQAEMSIAPRYECAFLGTAAHLVATGLGLTAFPRYAMTLTKLPNLVWRPLDRPLMVRSMGAVIRVGRTLSPSAVEFLAVLKRAAEELAS